MAPHWVGSWMAAPGNPSSRVLSDQTLRMIVAPHFGGRRLRIHLSNRFGSAPVTLGPATIAILASGASVVPRTMRTLTFRGSRTVTIAPGAEVVSDPVWLRTAPFQDIAVSLLVPGHESSVTEHPVTRQISYLTPAGSGDHTADGAGTAFSQATTTGASTGWYYLDGVDVEAPADTGSVVAFGDSLTDGFQPAPSGLEDLGNLNLNTRYPDYLQRLLTGFRVPLSVLNSGVTFDLLLQDFFAPAGIQRFAADVLDQAGARDVIVLVGINDIDAGASALQLIDGYENLIEQAHQGGLEIQLGTLTPFAGSASYTPAGEAVRTAVNSWIRSQRLSDGVVDFDAAVRGRSDPNMLAPQYDASDHLHLNPAGNWAMARAVPLNLLVRPRCSDRP